MQVWLPPCHHHPSPLTTKRSCYGNLQFLSRLLPPQHLVGLPVLGDRSNTNCYKYTYLSICSTYIPRQAGNISLSLSLSIYLSIYILTYLSRYSPTCQPTVYLFTSHTHPHMQEWCIDCGTYLYAPDLVKTSGVRTVSLY